MWWPNPATAGSYRLDGGLSHASCRTTPVLNVGREVLFLKLFIGVGVLHALATSAAFVKREARLRSDKLHFTLYPVFPPFSFLPSQWEAYAKDETNLFGSQKSWQSICNALAKTPRNLRAFLFQFLRNHFKLIYRTSHAPPGMSFESGIALSIESKGSIISAFDEPVSALVTISTPGLNR